MLISPECLATDIVLAELSHRLIVKLKPLAVLFDEGVIMATFGCARVDHNSFEVIGRRLCTRAEVTVEIKYLLKLKLGMDFDLEEGLEVEDYSLQIDDQYLGRLLD